MIPTAMDGEVRQRCTGLSLTGSAPALCHTCRVVYCMGWSTCPGTDQGRSLPARSAPLPVTVRPPGPDFFPLWGFAEL